MRISSKKKPWQDHYSRQAKKERFPARSVYKLEEIQKKHRPIKKGDKVLDLGCPGPWPDLHPNRRISPCLSSTTTGTVSTFLLLIHTGIYLDIVPPWRFQGILETRFRTRSVMRCSDQELPTDRLGKEFNIHSS